MVCRGNPPWLYPQGALQNARFDLALPPLAISLKHNNLAGAVFLNPTAFLPGSAFICIFLHIQNTMRGRNTTWTLPGPRSSVGTVHAGLTAAQMPVELILLQPRA